MRDEDDTIGAVLGETAETSVVSPPERFSLRAPCAKCACTAGTIQAKGQQDTVWCDNCGAWQYNAPRSETGKPVRHVKTRGGFKPAQRARILLLDGGRCVICQTTEAPLHVGHLLSVERGREQGLTDADLNDDENLAAMCEACNLGLGSTPVPIRIWARILMNRRPV